MRVTPTRLPSVLMIEPNVFGDARGYFFETWHKERYEQAGIAETFVQDNVSRSARGILRGMHMQQPRTAGFQPATEARQIIERKALDAQPCLGRATEERAAFLVVLAGNDHVILVHQALAQHDHVGAKTRWLAAISCQDKDRLHDITSAGAKTDWSMRR